MENRHEVAKRAKALRNYFFYLKKLLDMSPWKWSQLGIEEELEMVRENWIEELRLMNSMRWKDGDVNDEIQTIFCE